MTAALDWSYQLLSEPERSLLRRLALFSGGFSVAAASAVAADEIAALDVLACLANLVSKSIVHAGLSGSTVCYRLPLITRAYALEKLVESGEFEQVREAIKQAEQTIADYADGLNGGVRVRFGEKIANQRTVKQRSKQAIVGNQDRTASNLVKPKKRCAACDLQICAFSGRRWARRPAGQAHVTSGNGLSSASATTLDSPGRHCA